MKANDSLVVHKASGKSPRFKEEKIQCGEREAGGTWGARGCSNGNHRRGGKSKGCVSGLKFNSNGDERGKILN